MSEPFARPQVETLPSGTTFTIGVTDSVAGCYKPGIGVPYDQVGADSALSYRNAVHLRELVRADAEGADERWIAVAEFRWPARRWRWTVPAIESYVWFHRMAGDWVLLNQRPSRTPGEGDR